MENKQKDTVGLQLTKLNTLYQKPTNHARRKPMEQTKQEQFTTNCAIYGYKKDPENKYHWLIDEEAAAVVRRIFQLTIEGKGPYDIARTVWRSTITAWPSSHFTMAGTPACMWQTTTMLIAALLYDRKFE